MIKTVADFLTAYLEAEQKSLHQQNVTHPVTIGDMYEGLTKDTLAKAVFSNLDIHIETGSFIGECKTELDVIVAEGEGERIPHTDRFRFKPEQVLMVIQVKKKFAHERVER